MLPKIAAVAIGLAVLAASASRSPFADKNVAEFHASCMAQSADFQTVTAIHYRPDGSRRLECYLGEYRIDLLDMPAPK